MWCDQAKTVWSRSNSVFIFQINCMHHFHNYILQKIPLKSVKWFQRFEHLKDAKNNRKQKTFSALFGSILKSIFPTSDWFCLITSHMCDRSKLRHLSQDLEHGWKLEIKPVIRVYFEMIFLNVGPTSHLVSHLLTILYVMIPVTGEGLYIAKIWTPLFINQPPK